MNITNMFSLRVFHFLKTNSEVLECRKLKTNQIKIFFGGKKVKVYDEYQERFIVNLKIKGLQEVSFDGYFRVFSNFNTIIGKMNMKKLIQQVEKYFFEISQINNSTTFNSKRKHLNAYFNFLVSKCIIKSNPITDIPIKRQVENYEPKPTNTDDLQKLLSAIDIKTYPGFRDLTFIMLAVDTGMRPTEICRMTSDCVDLDNFSITITPEMSKTNKSRVVPVAQPVMQNIYKLIEINKETWDSDFIFLTEFGDQISTMRMQRRLRKHSEKAGVKITPYQLRHYFATEYLKSGGNLFYLQYTLGHSDIKMTKKYVKVDFDAISKAHNDKSPLHNVVKRNTRVKKLFI